MIYLIRHGLDDENYIGGWSDVDLIDKGIKQIENSREFIVGNLKVKKIITSDIKRAITTTTIINEKLQKEIIIDSKLRELDKGIYTGVKKESLKIDILNNIKNMTINDKYPNGESMKEFYERIKELILNLKVYEGDLIVTHRGVINMIYYYLNDIELDMDKEKFNVDHGSIHELKLEKNEIRRIY